MIKLKCRCGKVLNAKPEHAGKRLKCPACQAPIKIPAATSEAKTTTPRKRAKPPSKKQPSVNADLDEYGELPFDDDTGDGGFDDYGMHEYEPALPARRKSAKKKTRKKEETAKPAASDGPEISPKILYSLYGLSAVVVLTGLFFIVRSVINAGAADAAAQALPDSFRAFKHEGGRLGAEYPEGWLVESGGGTGGVPPWVRFKNEVQQVSISIRGSVSGTAISDIASVGGTLPGDLGEDIPDELDPVAAVHQFQKDRISAEYNSYEESEPRKIDSGFGEGRVSDFTGGSALSTEYGVRASLIANEYQYNVICKCPQKRLEEYKPIFERIVKSVGP